MTELRQSYIDLPEIEPLARFDMYASLGLVSVMEPETESLMTERAWDRLRHQDYGPHERPWHVSFHGSEFPGVHEDACERYLVYRMMDVPPMSPMPPWVTTTGVVGKAGELDLADAWFRGGRMLSIPEDDAWLPYVEGDRIHQLGFVDSDVWWTNSTDLPILPKGWTKPHIVEVKCKASEVVYEMMTGIGKDGVKRDPRGPDKSHVKQLKATIGIAHEYDWGRAFVCSKCWFIQQCDVYERLGLPGGRHPLSVEGGFCYCPRCGVYDEGVVIDLGRPTTGEIYYWDRSWPRTTKSFYFEYDSNFVAIGRSVLASAKHAFLYGYLPARPRHFQWGTGPCGDCQFKPSCRLDEGLLPRKRKPTEQPRTKLEESHVLDHAREVRSDYDYARARARVLQEWR
jgi:hypothetical protein